MQVNHDQKVTYSMPPGDLLSVTADSDSSGTVWQLSMIDGVERLGSTAIGAGDSTTFGPFTSTTRWEVVCEAGFLTYGSGGINLRALNLETGTVEINETYTGSHSHQTIAADLTLDPAAGSGTETNPKFEAAIMGNLHGADLTADSNYLAGVIGGYSVTGTKPGATYPIAGVLGVLFDGAQADGIVVADLDGDDGGAATNARAFFAVAVNNNNASSGVEYGVDLFDDGNPNYSGGGNTSMPSKAAFRFPNGTWFVTLDTAITANVTTTDAPAGSLGITSHATGAGKLFSSDGSKWQFTAVA